MEIYLYDAIRTPRGKGKPTGALAEISPTQLLVQLIHSLLERNQLPGEAIEDLLIGCVTQARDQGFNIAKTAALAANLPDEVAGMTINRFCASGLEAINMACGYLATQQMDRFLIAGGVESMSRVPLGSDGGAWYLDPDVAIPVHYIPQGVSADLIATLYGYSREDVDHYATLSHQRAHHATIQGYFHKSMIPVKDVIGNVILKEDETIRPDTSPETLATLPPAFEKVGNEWGFNAVALKKFPHLQSIHHVHHAGNSSGLADGAALVLLGTRETGALYGLKPRATIVSFAITGTDPTLMLLGPAPATRKALKRARMEVSDIDLFEVNEAFASVVLYYMDELKIPIEKVNVNGGAIAMGHPLGATGAMLLNILLDELERRDLEFGVVSMCIGGGMGIATVIQRVVNSHA